MTLPAFGEVVVHDEPFADGVERESQWLASTAARGESVAHLWQSTPALTVPRSYLVHAGWAQACAASAAAGWPVRVRSSAGGLVPLGPGVVNLSLAWRAAPAQPADLHSIYRDLCGALSRALAELRIHAVPQGVEGSFCDGRFNLAVGGRKIVGTAQAWRRIGGQQTLLAHAMIVATADPATLTETANRFEQALASARRYRADALTSVARAWCDAHARNSPPADLERRLLRALMAEFARPRRLAC